jgi:hypothetical protein
MHPLPDLEQIERWADGSEPLPDLETLKKISQSIGASRTAARTVAAAEGKRLRKLLVLAYPAGWRNVVDMERVTGLARQTIDKDLTEAGISTRTRAKFDQDKEEPTE